MKGKYYILLFFLLCTNLLFAQNEKFTVSVNKNPVATGEQFEVTFSLNGNGDRFTPPDFAGLEVLSGPNVSTNMTYINGTTTSSNSYSYDLSGLREGEITIGPAFIMVNGKRLSTNPLRIKIIKGQSVPRSSAAQQGGGQADQLSEGNPADLSKSLFIKAIVEKETVYEGQQLNLTYRLYTRIGIEQSQVDKLPDLNGFWNEDIKNLQQQVQWRVDTYKGVKYNVADLKQTILFPDHAGNLTIDPMGMTFLVRQQVPSRDIMDQFFGAFKDVKYKVKSAPVTIHVKPLPVDGKPASFAGAVGKFSLETATDKTDLKTNDALNYKVKITGSGNIKLLKNLNVDFPPDFEKYDPKITDSVKGTENGVSGYRVYNYLLIPRHHGDFTIDALKFSYFNPSTGKYVTLTAPAFHIKVAKGATESNVTALAADKQDIKLLDKDIRYIKTGEPELEKASDAFYGSWLFFLLLMAGPFACVITFYARNKSRKNNSDIVKVKSRRAGKIAAKHLASARQQLTVKNTKVFYENVFKGLYGYLGDKLNISSADLDRENIAAALKSKGINDELTKRLLGTLDLCEMARYAPVTHISEQEVFDKAKTIIQDIEDKI